MLLFRKCYCTLINCKTIDTLESMVKHNLVMMIYVGVTVCVKCGSTHKLC